MLSTEMESSAFFLPLRCAGRRGYTAETGQPQRELPGRKSDWPHLHLGLILTGPSFFDQFPELRILLQGFILPHGQV
jgi:hypothetical protein